MEKKKNKRKWWIWGSLALVLIIVIASVGGDGEASSEPPAKKELTVEQMQARQDSIERDMNQNLITAWEVADIYNENELRGDKMFKDKYLYVEGVVETVAKDVLDNVYVSLSAGDFETIQIYMKSEDDAMQLSQGDKAIIRAIGDEYGLGVTCRHGQLIKIVE